MNRARMGNACSDKKGHSLGGGPRRWPFKSVLNDAFGGIVLRGIAGTLGFSEAKPLI